MKKILLIVAIAISTFSLNSCKSKEDKANELIKQEMFKTLYDFESYQPVETLIDSAFTNPCTNDTIIYAAMKAVEDIDKCLEALDEVKDAQRSMSIWSDSYSSYGRSEYREAKDKMEEAYNKAKENMQQHIAAIKVIRKKSVNYPHEFIGWQATHKYRCKTKGGHSALGTELYIFDKGIKNVLFSINVEDEDYIKAVGYIKDISGYSDEEFNKFIQDAENAFK
ncbi:MAG: hypothetical protein ACOXZI_03825 [Candidatus Cryptobacteroides sp.]|jgi:hypothetical protein